MRPLIPEIVLAISNFLIKYKSVQIKLALLSHQCYGLVIPSVYHTATISSSNSILSLCYAVNCAEKQLGSFVKRLSIHSRCTHGYGNLSLITRAVRLILRNTPNVEDLRLLCHIQVSFGEIASRRVRRVETFENGRTGFSTLFERQRHLNTLTIAPSCADFSDSSLSNELEDLASTELTEFTGSPEQVVAFVPRQPVSMVNIRISYHDLFDPVVHIKRLEDLADALAQSAIPVVELSFLNQSEDEWVWAFLTFVGGTSVSSSLRKLTICTPLEWITKRVPTRYNSISHILRFPELEYLEIKSNGDPDCDSSHLANGFSDRREHYPRLKIVKLLGKLLE